MSQQLKEDVTETDEEEEGAHLLPKGQAGYGTSQAAARTSTDEAEGFLTGLHNDFGLSFLTLLFVIQHLLKGFAKSLVDQAAPYVYRSYRVPAPQVQIYGGVTEFPWAVKPILGLVSDVVPLFGYHKVPYMLLTSLVGIVSLLYIGAPAFGVPVADAVQPMVVCLVLFNLQVSMCDLLSEAKYAERIAQKPKRGSALVSYVWFGLQAGSMVAVLLSGPLIEQFGPRAGFVLAAVPAVATVLPLALGCLEEKRVTEEELVETRRKYSEQVEACFLCVLMLVGTMTIMITGLVYKEPGINCMVSMSVGAVMLVAFSIVLSPTIARFNAFSLLQVAFNNSYSGAAFYFYTDTEEMYPDGPHFSKFFYNSVMGVVGSMCSLLGIVSYHRYLSTWSYRSVIIFGSLVVSVFSMLDIVMFARLNKQLGIPDSAFVLSLSACETVVAQWCWMPGTLMLASLCPRGMEATMYALLAGCHNLGLTISANNGAFLLELSGCRPRGAPNESAQFEHLWRVAAVSAVLPLVSALLLQRLIPDVAQGSELLDPQSTTSAGVSSAISAATAGSLWRRWRWGTN